MDNWKPVPPPLPIEEVETEEEDSAPEGADLENTEESVPLDPKQRLVESARRSNRTIAEMIRDGLRISDLNEDELALLLESQDAQARAKRTQIYVYLREHEGFTRDELNRLDRFPLSKLGVESRRILAEKARRGATVTKASGDYDDGGPPDVPATRSSYRPFTPTPKYDPMAIIKSETASKREKERARIEILKQRAQKPRVPRTEV